MQKHLLTLLLGGLLALTVHAASPTDLTLRVTPERDLLYSHGPGEVIVQIDLDARRLDLDTDKTHRAPMNLAIVLDRSGSMQGAKIEKARQAACVAIDQLTNDDIFSLVIFDNETEVILPPEPVGDERHREAMKERIDHIRPRGSTAIYAGVNLGARQLRKNFDKERVNRVILLSDGIANVGPSRTADLAALGRDLRRDGIAVTTVGLGDDYNEDLMTALAEASNANYVRDAEKLPGIFAEELGATRSIVARGVIIRITAPEGVRVREIMGRPEIDCSKHTVEIPLPEYFGGEKRRFLARCTVEADKASTKPFEVASVDLKYETSSGTKEALPPQNARVSFTEEERKSKDSLHPEVAQGVAILNNCLVKERAVKLADEGRAKDAADLLRQQAIANKALPAPAQLPGQAEENRKLEAAASEVESKGAFEKSSRKQIQYENWQDKNQKR